MGWSYFVSKCYYRGRNRGGWKCAKKITKIFTNKFDKPYYCWSRVPRHQTRTLLCGIRCKLLCLFSLQVSVRLCFFLIFGF
ncbi:hypothetical protein YC2023_081791 [Brassica napus]